MTRRINALFFVPLILSLIGCEGRKKDETASALPRPVTVMVLQETDASRLDRQAGTVSAWKTEEIGFEVSGRVTFVAEEGTAVEGRISDTDGKPVRSGSKLAALDPVRYELEVASVQAQIDTTKQQREAVRIEAEDVLPAEERATLDGLDTAFVEGEFGKVPLNAIATIQARWDPGMVVRRDLNRTIEVRSQVEQGVRGNDVVLAVMASESLQQLQSEMAGGYQVEVGGSLEDSQEGAGEISLSFGISFLTIVLLLVIQYNGWAKPIIILTTLPLAMIGALPGLWITGNPLGFMPQLGILSLFGIVLNTGIIFIEFADMLIKDAADRSDGSGPICGLTRDEFRTCLVEAGKQRLLPIFLTTSTTIGGLLPLALSGGPLWEGMSWCMIFGLLVATLLTLLVVPALYAICVETFGVKPFRVDEAPS